MNYRINEENYFNQKLRSEIWEKGEENQVLVKIEYYHKTLKTIINTTNKYFSIEKIMEPQPIIKFKNKDEKNYNYLKENPHFLIIKSKKKNN